MPTLEFTTHINRPITEVFNLITDLANYSRWLPQSETYHGIHSISDHAVKLGTTYADQGARITFHGKVTRYESPTYVTFHQAAKLNLFVIKGGLDIQIMYDLASVEGGTRLNRQQIVE
jgi:uncharacterized protein YndB with AHSA1/START domain